MNAPLSASKPSLLARIFRRDRLPFLTTCLVCALLYTAASYYYPGFFAFQNTANLFGDNAVLGIVAVGLTFVILSGGIDLSVGAIVGCGTIILATLIMNHGWHPLAAFALLLVAGTALGLFSGLLIHFFEIPPFLVTLGTLFFARGLGLVISTQSIDITHPFYETLTSLQLPLPAGTHLSLIGCLFLVLLLATAFVAAYRPFGRYVYAVGGNESSALLMGLPVARTKVGVYAFSGFCSALAACATTVYSPVGDATKGVGLELDAIAAVVVGGTLLTGGVGTVLGTLVGVLIFGIIQSALTFDGRFSSWWSRIAVGILLLVFILLQKLLQPRENQP